MSPFYNTARGTARVEGREKPALPHGLKPSGLRRALSVIGLIGVGGFGEPFDPEPRAAFRVGAGYICLIAHPVACRHCALLGGDIRQQRTQRIVREIGSS